jgi:tetratricopeptide (TPR) repeat protein
MEKSKWACAACGKKRAKFRCACKWESYCGVQCQKKRWDTHKGSCTVLLSKNVKLAQEASTDCGHVCQEVVTAMMTLAEIIGAQDRYDEAEKMMLDALQIARVLCGTEPGLLTRNRTRNVAPILHSLGHVLQQQDKLEEAVEKFEESYGIYVDWYGPDHVSIAPNKMSMGSLWCIMGVSEEAHEQFGHALKLYRAEYETTGAENWKMHIATCLCSVGSLYAESKDFVSAVDNYTEALDIQRSLAPGGPNAGDTLMFIVDLLVLQDKLVEALSRIEEALPILRGVYGPRSVTISRALMRLGDIYQKQREFDMSLKAFRKARKSRSRVLGEDNVLVAEANDCIAGVLIHKQEFDEALGLLKTVAPIYCRARGSNHLCVAQAYYKMSKCLEEQGDLAGALCRAMDAHSIYSQLGANHEGDAQIAAIRVESLKVLCCHES